ncbi:MAG: DNA-formamidopyrimidine glycosylase family protein [Myxococcota bacterium]
MPELPETEVCREQLERWAAGRVLDEVLVRDAAVVRKKMSSRPSDQLPGGDVLLQKLVGNPSESVQRHGKRLGWRFGPHGVLVHLGMTGHWVRRPSGPQDKPSARLGLRFGGETLWMMDRRRMGCVVFLQAEDLGATLRKGHGPDALDRPLTGAQLAVAMRSRKPIKVVLMEQNRLAGIGNIHASEACFRGGVHPATSADAVSPERFDRLATGIVDQLSYTLGLADPDAETIYVTRGADNPFAVYKRDGLPCRTCGTPIESGDLNGRTTYWCPTCQPAGA